MKRITETELIERLEKMVNNSSAKTVAEQCGVSPQYICDVLKRRRQPAGKLAESLGLRRVVLYEPMNGDRK